MRSIAGSPRTHRLLPIAGGSVAGLALLAHFGGSALLVHLGLGAALLHLGLSPANIGPGGLAFGLAALVALKVLAVLGRRRWPRQR